MSHFLGIVLSFVANLRCKTSRADYLETKALAKTLRGTGFEAIWPIFGAVLFFRVFSSSLDYLQSVANIVWYTLLIFT